VVSAGGFNFIQQGFEPLLNGIQVCIYLTTYRSGRFLLNEVKKLHQVDVLKVFLTKVMMENGYK